MYVYFMVCTKCLYFYTKDKKVHQKYILLSSLHFYKLDFVQYNTFNKDAGD